MSSIQIASPTSLALHGRNVTLSKAKHETSANLDHGVGMALRIGQKFFDGRVEVSNLSASAVDQAFPAQQ